MWRKEGADLGTEHMYSSVVECFLASINPKIQPQYGGKLVRGNKTEKSIQKKDGHVVTETGLESQSMSRIAGHHQKLGRPQNDDRGVSLGLLTILISDLQPPGWETEGLFKPISF